jgi:hypothetical protein
MYSSAWKDGIGLPARHPHPALPPGWTLQALIARRLGRAGSRGSALAAIVLVLPFLVGGYPPAPADHGGDLHDTSR